MSVYIVMATINGSDNIRGVYRREIDAIAESRRVKELSFFREEDGDVVWVHEENVKWFL